jgi:hypothetical protein
MAIIGQLIPREERRERVEPVVVQAAPTQQPQVVYVEKEDKSFAIVLIVLGVLLLALGLYKLTK